MDSKSSGWYRILFIILAVLYIFAGITLIMNPTLFAGSMIYMIGLLAIFYGVILVVSYFLATNFKNIFTLIVGIVLVILGILISTHLFEASVALGVVAAIAFIAIGAFKMYQAFVVKELGVSSWWTILILALCNLVVGLIMIFNLNDSGTLITVLIGTNLLVNGFSDLMLGFSAF